MPPSALLRKRHAPKATDTCLLRASTAWQHNERPAVNNVKYGLCTHMDIKLSDSDQLNKPPSVRK